MPSNPVDEAREEEIAWLEYFSTELVGMWALMSLAEREHAEVSFLAGYRAALTLSAPDTSVWLVEKDERSRTGQHLWSMWHLDGHVEWTPDANLADQYETQAEAGMAALRITEAKGSPCHATEHVFIEGLSAPSAPAEKEG